MSAPLRRPAWPAFGPTPGMTPSMPQPGAGQDFYDPALMQQGTGPYVPAYSPLMNDPWAALDPYNDPYQPQPFIGQQPDPWMGQPSPQDAYPQAPQQPQQRPGSHPILDKLMSPEMADRAMAAAIFARGFVAPQEAINWAMQIRSQRQAQQMRAEQSKAEWDARAEIAKHKGEADKVAKDRTRAGQIIDKADITLRQAGGDPTEYLAQHPDFDPTDPLQAQEYSRHALRKNAEKKALDATAKKQQQDFSNEMKVAGQVIDTGVIPSNFKDSEVVAAAAAEYARKQTREGEFDRYKLELEKAKAAIAKEAAGTFKNAAWTHNMTRLQTSRTKTSQLESKLFLLQQNERYMATVSDNEAMKQAWLSQMEATQSELEKWQAVYEEADANLRDMVNVSVKKVDAISGEPPLNPGEPANEEDGQMLPEQVEQQFVDKYLSLNQPLPTDTAPPSPALIKARKERLIKFMQGKYPGYLVNAPAE